jgi:hypothetical protein
MVVILGKRVVTPDHRLHGRLFNLLIIIEALARAIGGSANINPGDRAMFACTSLDIAVALPVFGPLFAALHKIDPTEIHIGFEHKPLPLDKRFNEWARGWRAGFSTDVLNRLFFSLMAPIYVEFYEAYTWFIRGKFRSPQYRPELWRFAKTVRDSISHHAGRFRQDRQSTPVKWRNLSYSRDDDGKLIIGGDMTLGDIIVLIFDLSDDLDDLGCPS